MLQAAVGMVVNELHKPFESAIFVDRPSTWGDPARKEACHGDQVSPSKACHVEDAHQMGRRALGHNPRTIVGFIRFVVE